LRIAVLGAGALGSVLGSLLWRAGEDVVLVGRAAHVAAIRAAGLSVEGVLGGFNATPHAEERLSARPELALLTVRARDVVAVLRENAALLAGVPIVVLQNGLRGEELAATAVPADQLVSGVVALHAQYVKAGHVMLLESAGLLVGRPEGANDQTVEQIRAVLDKAVPTAVSDNMRGARWTKLILSLGDVLVALHGPVKAHKDPALRELAAGLAREGMAVAARAGIRLEPIPGTSLPLTELPEHRGPRSLAEPEYLNGEVVRLGKALGVPTPLNEAAMALARGVAARADLLVSYPRSLYGPARREIERLLARFGDRTPGVEKSGIPGICVVHSRLDPRQVVAQCAALCGSEPAAFRFTLKWVPVDYWCEKNLDAMQALLAERVAPRIAPHETWAMQVEKRGWAEYHTAQIIERLAEAIDRRVSLKAPDKLVRLDILARAVAVSVLRPGEVFSIAAQPSEGVDARQAAARACSSSASSSASRPR
jgi:2-dehydropantoate 2-reductase